MKKTEAIRLAEIQARENERTRVYALITHPAVMGMMIAAGGLLLANEIEWDHVDKTRSNDVRAAFSAASVMMGLSTAGVHDRYLVGGASIAAGLSGLKSLDISAPINAKEIIDVGASTVIGATIGTAIFPVVGTIIGGMIGGGAGYGLYRGTGGK